MAEPRCNVYLIPISSFSTFSVSSRYWTRLLSSKKGCQQASKFYNSKRGFLLVNWALGIFVAALLRSLFVWSDRRIKPIMQMTRRISKTEGKEGKCFSEQKVVNNLRKNHGDYISFSMMHSASWDLNATSIDWERRRSLLDLLPRAIINRQEPCSAVPLNNRKKVDRR